MKHIFKSIKRRLAGRQHPADDEESLDVREDGPYYPFVVKQNENGEYYAALYAEDEYKKEHFDERNLEGSGYDWEKLAARFIREEMPDDDDEIHFDSEAGMFYAYCDSESRMRRFVEAFRSVCEDDAAMSAMLACKEED